MKPNEQWREQYSRYLHEIAISNTHEEISNYAMWALTCVDNMVGISDKDRKDMANTIDIFKAKRTKMIINGK